MEENSDQAAAQRRIAELEAMLAGRDQVIAKLKENDEMTTLTECINASHNLISCRLRVEMNPKYATTGVTNSPRGKACPTLLTPWHSFEEDKRCILRSLHDNVAAERLFNSYNDIKAWGAMLDARYPLASEKDLEQFMFIGIESPVKTIIDGLRRCQETSIAFGIGDNISFKNHTHYLSEVADEIVDRSMTASTSSEAPQTPDGRSGCLYRTLQGEQTVVYISEYKAPHKLTSEQLPPDCGK